MSQLSVRAIYITTAVYFHDARNGLKELVLSGVPDTPNPMREYNGLRCENRGPFKGQQASVSNPVMSTATIKSLWPSVILYQWSLNGNVTPTAYSVNTSSVALTSLLVSSIPLMEAIMRSSSCRWAMTSVNHVLFVEILGWLCSLQSFLIEQYRWSYRRTSANEI